MTWFGDQSYAFLLTRGRPSRNIMRTITTCATLKRTSTDRTTAQMLRSLFFVSSLALQVTPPQLHIEVLFLRRKLRRFCSKTPVTTTRNEHLGIGRDLPESRVVQAEGEIEDSLSSVGCAIAALGGLRNTRRGKFSLKTQFMREGNHVLISQRVVLPSVSTAILPWMELRLSPAYHHLPSNSGHFSGGDSISPRMRI
jgi:hypothetical protein